MYNPCDTERTLDEEAKSVGRQVDVNLGCLLDHVTATANIDPRQNHLVDLADARYFAQRLIEHKIEDLFLYI